MSLSRRRGVICVCVGGTSLGIFITVALFIASMLVYYFDSHGLGTARCIAPCQPYCLVRLLRLRYPELLYSDELLGLMESRRFPGYGHERLSRMHAGWCPLFPLINSQGLLRS